MRDFLASVQRSGIRKVLRAELVVRERDESGIIPGCGMLVVNSPYRFDAEAKHIVAYLAKKLVVSGKGSGNGSLLLSCVPLAGLGTGAASCSSLFPVGSTTCGCSWVGTT